MKLRLAPPVCKLFFKGLLENTLYTPQAYLQQMSCTDHSNVQDTWSGAVHLTNISLVVFYFLGQKACYLKHLSEIPQEMSSKQAIKSVKPQNLAWDRWVQLGFSEQRARLKVI